MAIKTVSPDGEQALTESIRFHDQVYQHRAARWPARIEMQLPVFPGLSAMAREVAMRPSAARNRGETRRAGLRQLRRLSPQLRTVTILP